MALTLSAQTSLLLCPAFAAHDTLAAFTVGLWFRGSGRTNNARWWAKSSSVRLTSTGTSGDVRSVMDVVEAPPDIFNATSSGAPVPGGTTWWCIIVEQSLADGVRIYVGDETTLPAEVPYSDRTAGDPLLTVTDDSADQFRFGGTGTGSSQTQAGDYSFCMRMNRVATAQEREDWWRTLALPTDGSVLGDWRPGENGLIDVPDHGPLGLDLALSGTISVTGADPTLPGPAGGTTASGVISLTLGVGGTATSVVEATSSVPLTLGVSATATATATAATTIPLVLGVAATATVTVEASGVVPLALGAQATAAPVATASATVPLVLGLAAQAVNPVTVTGTVPLTLGVSGQASTPSTGTTADVVIPLVLGASATATSEVAAAGTIDLTLGASGSATATAVAAGTVPFALGISASAVPSVTVAGTVALTLGASGTATVTGLAAGTVPLSLQATGLGSPTVTGDATVPLALAISATAGDPFSPHAVVRVSAVTMRMATAVDVTISTPRATEVTLSTPRATEVVVLSS